MAGFDKSLDKEIYGKDISFETTKIRVSLMSYNEAKPKVQISRENLNNESGEWRWSKLGRMTKDETIAIIPVLEEAVKKIE